MKSTRQQVREARRLFRLCLVDGSLDETRVRRVVQQTIASGGPGNLKMLSRFQRLVRLNRFAHSAHIESSTPLAADLRASIESNLTRLYGRNIVTSYAQDAKLLGGVRVTVGSDVWDGSIQGRLEAIEVRF